MFGATFLIEIPFYQDPLITRQPVGTGFKTVLVSKEKPAALPLGRKGESNRLFSGVDRAEKPIYGICAQKGEETSL